MNAISTFDSSKQLLQMLLQDIKSGKIQLPDFQRGWVWSDGLIRSLLASVSLSYPIGAVMMLQTGNAHVRFKPRTLEGVPQDAHTLKPDWLILDGQQRLTSLFLALYSEQPVETKDVRGKPVKRWYYLDIRKALNPNIEREEAIVSLPEDRCIRNFQGKVIEDYSSLTKECMAELIPFSAMFDIVRLNTWQMEYLKVKPSLLQERLHRWNDLQLHVIQRFQQYQLPLITLSKDTPKEAVCQVFEKVNTGGVSLTVFELLTATYAAESFELRKDWEGREERFKKHAVLDSMENTDFLQTVTLLTTYAKRAQKLAEDAALDTVPGVSCRRRDILQLSLEEYRTWADDATKGFEEAVKLLYSQKIFDARDLPYKTQMVPLAAILAVLKKRADEFGVQAKIARWYWCGVFGELYGSAVETRFAKDVPEVLAWIDGGPEPSTVADANFAPRRLLTLRTRTSAAYKGLYILLLKGGKDFRSGNDISLLEYFEAKIDIHHIFPQDWCKKNRIDVKLYDTIVNKTALSASTNREIGGNKPSAYLARIQKKYIDNNEAQMDDILRSHAIDPVSLRANDFMAFFKAREAALLECIAKAMGKSLSSEIIQAPVEEVEEFVGVG